MNNNTLYDPVRKINVIAQPEEVARQKLILKMINEFGYPKSLLAIEKELCRLPHLKNTNFKPKKRRADIICFAKNIHPNYLLYPLLMIECKACYLDKKTIEQVLGYNYYVKAYFVAIANENEIITFWYNVEKKKYNSVNFLPSYNQLIKAIRYE